MTAAPAEVLILDAVRAGVLLMAEGDALRFKATRPMPPDLAERIKANRAIVLATLRPTTPDDYKRPPPVTHTNPYRYRCTMNPQRQGVVDLLAEAWDRDPQEARDLADAWKERMEIMRGDGHLDSEAEATAWQEMLNQTEKRFD